jgi:hypothetical protein
MMHAVALFVSFMALVDHDVSAERIVHDMSGVLNANFTGGMKSTGMSRIAVTAGRSSSAMNTVDKVLRTFAEHVGMLPGDFDREWPLVRDLYNAHCCPQEEPPPPGLPVGGKDVSFFIADYSKLPSLAVLVAPKDPVRAKFAVVYDKGSSIGAPIFGLLDNIDATSVRSNLKLVIADSTDDVGIFKVPDRANQVAVYLTAKGLQHENAFNAFKLLGKIDDTAFKSQARTIATTVTVLGGEFHMSPEILHMLDVPRDSLVVADPSALPEKRSLAILFTKGKIHPAMVSTADYAGDDRWRVFVRYLTNEKEQVVMNVLDATVTCAMFGPDLTRMQAPPRPDNELKNTFVQLLESAKNHMGVDPFRAATIAANDRKMPKLEIPEGYFDTKVKTLPFENGPNMYVLYHHSQRKYAYDHKRIFEHVFAGPQLLPDWTEKKQPGPIDFYYFEALEKLITKPAAMTFLLSEYRFAMGWPMDGVEVGAGHNCLILDETEKVYIAGEILFDVDGSVKFNFNSGTFTRQIAPMYFAGVHAHEIQWKGLIATLISKTWYSAVTQKYGNVKLPQVTYTDEVLIPFAPPVQATQQAFCQSKPWMRKCACMAYEDSHINYCDVLDKKQQVDLCDHDKCHPP